MTLPARMLVIGAEGQLARSLAALDEESGFRIFPCGRPVVDLCEPDTIAAAIARLRPDIVVNAAAYTAVDRAESETERAFAINATGAGAVATAAAQSGLPVIHVSTDYVFPGHGTDALREDDETGPRSAYGRSKLAGEELVAAGNGNHAILRTAWVFSPWGGNFVKTMLRLAGERDVLRVVDDQNGNPSYAPDLANAIAAVAAGLLVAPDDEDLRGVFHVAGPDTMSWYEFAAAIMQASEELGGPFPNRIERIGSGEYPTPAERPKNSCLDTGKLARTYGIRLPPLSVSLWKCVAQLLLDGTVPTRRNAAPAVAPLPAEVARASSN